METTGKLKVKFDAIQVSEKFKKRDFVITIGTDYPQHVTFQLNQDKCSLIDNINIDSDVEVHFNLRGREWVNKEGETKYFNTIEAWKVKAVGATSAQADTAVTQENPTVTQANPTVTPEDDLPF
jgi:hypothetical protein